MARRFCRAALIALAALYVLALLVWLAGTFGLFGAERDPLSAVFLMPLGLPWNLLVDRLPEPLWPWLAAAAPLVNRASLRLVFAWATGRTP